MKQMWLYLVLLLGYTVLHTDAIVTITPHNTLSDGVSFEKGSEGVIMCTINPYTAYFTWKIDNSVAADCLPMCTVYSTVANYAFTFDTSNGIFNITINPINDTDNGKVFLCDDGSTPASFTVKVEEKTMLTYKPVNERSWCKTNKTWCIVLGIVFILFTVAYFVQIALVVGYKCKAKGIQDRREYKVLTDVGAMEEEMYRKRKELLWKIKNRITTRRIDKVPTGIEHEKRTVNQKRKMEKLENLGEIEGGNIQDRREYKVLTDVGAIEEEMYSKRKEPLSKIKNRVTTRSIDKVPTEIEHENRIVNQKRKMEKLENLGEIEERRIQDNHEHVEITVEGAIERQTLFEKKVLLPKIKSTVTTRRIDKVEREEEHKESLEYPKRKMEKLENLGEIEERRIIDNSDHNEFTAEGAVPMHLINSTKLHFSRDNKERKWIERIEQLEYSYTVQIKERERKLQQLGKTEKRSNSDIMISRENPLNTAFEMSTERDMNRMENMQNEDEKLKYYKIKREILELQKKMTAELSDEYRGRNVDEGMVESSLSEDEVLSLPSEEGEQHKQEERGMKRKHRQRESRVGSLRKVKDKLDEQEKKYEKKIEEEEEYLKKQKDIRECKRCSWFWPVIGYFTLAYRCKHTKTK